MKNFVAGKIGKERKTKELKHDKIRIRNDYLTVKGLCGNNDTIKTKGLL